MVLAVWMVIMTAIVGVLFNIAYSMNRGLQDDKLIKNIERYEREEK